MTVIFAYALFIGTTIIALVMPWVGVVAGYLLAIWVPLATWPWIFGRFRVVYYIALATILGWAVAVLRGKIRFSVLKSRQNLWLLVLWVCLGVSYFFPPIAVTPTSLAIENPDYLIQNITKVLLFYFVAILTIDSKKKCHVLVWVMLFSAIHLIYWGNMEYFGGRMKGLHNTLIGPGYRYVVSVYVDENAFAMFFVVAIPFLYFMGNYYRNLPLKWFLWLNIPFAWHCIFLTGSRGGLLGLGVVTLFMVARSKLRLFQIAIPIVLTLAFVYQSGHLIKIKGKSVLNNLDEDSSAQGRLDSWETGMKMMMDHPLTGVGIGNYQRAYPYYAHTEVIVAHNTVIQFAAESGVLAGLMYLLLCYGVLSSFLRYRKSERLNIDPFFVALQESLTGALAGFFVCAMFLNLATYELFYYLLLLQAIHNRLVTEVTEKSHSSEMQTVPSL